MHALESSFIFSIYFILLHYIYLIRKQMRIDAVQVPPPSPFALTVELAYTSTQITIFEIFILLTSQNTKT